MPNSKTQSNIDFISNFFKNFEQKISKIEFEYKNETSYLDKIFASLDVARREILISDCLNEERKKLIKKLKSLQDTQLKIHQQSKNKNNLSSTLRFIPSHLTFESIELLGHMNLNSRTLAQRINHLHLQHAFINHSHQTLPTIDHLISLSVDKIARIDLDQTSMAVIKISNPLRGKKSNEIKLNLMPQKKRFQYCRAAANSFLLVFFEIEYERKYELEIYSLASLKLKSSRLFEYYVDNFCSNETEIAAWSPNSQPYLVLFDYDLNEIKLASNFFDSKLFETFYSMSDFNNENLMLFHSQHLIGIVSRKTGKIVKELDMSLLENEFQQSNQENVMLHAKFEFINLKFVNNKQIILSTWSSIMLIDWESAEIKAKDKLKNIRNFQLNPFRLDINSNDGYCYLHDRVTKFLIYF
jgi:hypothetical protein